MQRAHDEERAREARRRQRLVGEELREAEGDEVPKPARLAARVERALPDSRRADVGPGLERDRRKEPERVLGERVEQELHEPRALGHMGDDEDEREQQHEAGGPRGAAEAARPPQLPRVQRAFVPQAVPSERRPS